MPRHWLKRRLPTPESVRNSRALRVLGTLLHDPNLWHLNRRAVAGGLAVGLFFAFVPLPLQMVQAALVAVLLRVNLPIAVTAIWVTNPFTIPPLFYLAYRFGAWLLGTPPVARPEHFSVSWALQELGQNWQPLLLGSLLFGLFAAAGGWALVHLLWRLHIVQALRRRRRLLGALRRGGGDEPPLC
ncbi:MAG: hypothetical protein KatS3mg121_1550 [Gammaproteobacteria bacterium]|nr:MAG: hypothetical protein KatS3mg121_1550 [Gammaproteobacteria bacterium]